MQAAIARLVPKIAPSMLASDFANLAGEARRMVDCGADWLHMDVMVRWRRVCMLNLVRRLSACLRVSSVCDCVCVRVCACACVCAICTVVFLRACGTFWSPLADLHASPL